MHINQAYRGKSRVEEVFDRVRSDDQLALKELFSIYFPRLNDFARKVIKDDEISQDIVQEVFVRLWEKRQQIASLNIEALLFRMVRNRCIDYIKHLKVVNNHMQEFHVESRYEELYRIDFLGDEPYVLIEKEVQEKIGKVISKLPDRCREVFILSRVKGLRNREIAELLSISIKNVERHLQRAIRSFRDNLPNEIPFALVVLVLKNLGN